MTLPLWAALAALLSLGISTYFEPPAPIDMFYISNEMRARRRKLFKRAKIAKWIALFFGVASIVLQAISTPN